MPRDRRSMDAATPALSPADRCGDPGTIAEQNDAAGIAADGPAVDTLSPGQNPSIDRRRRTLVLGLLPTLSA